MLWDGLDHGVQWLLAVGAVAYWMITALSRAHDRYVAVRTAATRSRRDADLAEAKHRDTLVSGMISQARSDYRWDKERDRGKE